MKKKGSEAGFSLIELVIAVLIYGIVLAGAIGFVATQNRMFHLGMDRMSALQNLRYALNSLETDIPTLGTNLPAEQPALVYAGASLIAFTGDYASNVRNDVFASFVDLGAPNGQVSAPTSAIDFPLVSESWPDTTYQTAAGTRSPGELLIFWFADDTTTSRTDDYVMYRQVNNAEPEVVSRDLLAPENGDPFFRYFKRTDYASQFSSIDSVPDNQLPLRHTSRFHAVPADTGSSARADSIRAVRISLRSTNGLTGERERTAEVTRVISMPNAGWGVSLTCGDEPLLGTAIAAATVDLGGGDWAVNLTWNAATDETMGEADVARYVIYRQEVPVTADWGDPYLSIPAGNTTYQYQDQAVEGGKTYQYALAAQDCTPSLSNLATSNNIAVPS